MSKDPAASVCLYKDRLKQTNRVIPIWNSSPNYVVSAETVDTFKQRLDKFWIDQDVMYNYKDSASGRSAI